MKRRMTEKLKAALNSYIPTRSEKERFNLNRAVIVQHSKVWFEQNKDNVYARRKDRRFLKKQSEEDIESMCIILTYLMQTVRCRVQIQGREVMAKNSKG